jgi:broad specificity phosphatase PhoE
LLVYILRHGTAFHLLVDYKRKVNYHQFSELIKEWIIVSLTDVGRSEIEAKAEELKNTAFHLHYSPLIRTRESANLLLKIRRSLPPRK